MVAGLNYGLNGRLSSLQVIKRSGDLLKSAGWLSKSLSYLLGLSFWVRVYFLLNVEHIASQVGVVIDTVGNLFIGVANSCRASASQFFANLSQ